MFMPTRALSIVLISSTSSTIPVGKVGLGRFSSNKIILSKVSHTSCAMRTKLLDLPELLDAWNSSPPQHQVLFICCYHLPAIWLFSIFGNFISILGLPCSSTSSLKSTYMCVCAGPAGFSAPWKVEGEGIYYFLFFVWVIENAVDLIL